MGYQTDQNNFGYIVQRADGVKEHNAEYFVLRVDKEPDNHYREASLAALKEFANFIHVDDPELADEIYHYYFDHI